MSRGEVLDYFKFQKAKKREKNLTLLKKAKFNILNGDFKSANFYLKSMDSKHRNLLFPKLRLQALILFLKGNYRSSFKILNDPQFYWHSYYKEVCLLKVLNLIALNGKKRLKRESKKCQEVTFDFSKKKHFWLKQIIKLKLGHRTNFGKESPLQLKKIFLDRELTVLWLKLSIFLNKEKQIYSKLSELPKRLYKSKKIRELISFIHYRVGRKKLALNFIEDISTANAENIKGNIKLKNREFELAYGHFQLALKRKVNSKNALERSLPLSWILKKWKTGQNIIKSTLNEEIDKNKKLALNTAFDIQRGFFDKASLKLKYLNYAYTGFVPLEILLMDSYVAVMNEKVQDLKQYSHEACQKFDGLNCWLRSQLLTWENFPKTIKRNDPIYSDNRLTLDSLIELSITRPLKEELIVDQKDIEELDSAEVYLPKGLIYKGIFD